MRNARQIRPAEGSTDVDRPLMPFDEIRDHSGDLSHLQIAATAQFAGDVLGNIFRPALGGIEGDDADRVVLPGDQVLNYRFEVGGCVIGFPPGAAYSTESSTTR